MEILTTTKYIFHNISLKKRHLNINNAIAGQIKIAADERVGLFELKGHYRT